MCSFDEDNYVKSVNQLDVIFQELSILYPAYTCNIDFHHNRFRKEFLDGLVFISVVSFGQLEKTIKWNLDTFSHLNGLFYENAKSKT